MKKQLSNIILAGAAPDTGNHGVTALALSLLCGLAERGLNQATVLDNGGGMGFGESIPVKYTTLALKPGKRLYQPNNMHQVRVRQLFGLPSPVLSAIKQADAVLDVSGGDSFTDMYGLARFEQIVLPKLMAIDAGIPLILLPQTYGPYQFKKTRDTARQIIRKATLAFARDEDSFENLKSLLGSDFDPLKHRLGVDLAFGLPTVPSKTTTAPKPVGINVSGLLWHNVKMASQQFGLTTDYREALVRFCTTLLEFTDDKLLLVPHVRPSGGSECDLVAARALKSGLPLVYRDRIEIEELANSPEALKGVIANTCWFTGSRMHATIAALSSGVPVSNLAYSMKAKGVFASCLLADQVFDLRSLTTDQTVEALWRSFLEQHQLKQRLRFSLPTAQRQWGYQMDTISNALNIVKEAKEAAYA